jgi:hypothetical protein
MMQYVLVACVHVNLCANALKLTPKLPGSCRTEGTLISSEDEQGSQARIIHYVEKVHSVIQRTSKAQPHVIHYANLIFEI